jgi:hypothetical protein
MSKKKKQKLPSYNKRISIITKELYCYETSERLTGAANLHYLSREDKPKLGTALVPKIGLSSCLYTIASKQNTLCRICGSQSVTYEICHLLGYSTF